MSQAVHERILAVRDQWLSFCEEPEGRVLCWQIGGDGLDILRAFLEFESGEHKELPHLFVPLQIPFEGAGYEDSLITEVQKYVDDLAQDEESPEALPSVTGQKHLADALFKIQKSEPELIEVISATLMPEKTNNLSNWKQFLQCQLEHDKWPPTVKFMVLDSLVDPALKDLIKAFPKSFIVRELSADIAEIAQEIAHENQASGPGPDFQKAYADLNAATAKGNTKNAKSAAKRADAIAEKEGWHGMRVAVSFNLGAANLKEKDDDEALKNYRTAEKHAVAAQEEKEPGSEKLVYQSLLSQASVHFKNRRYSHASLLYQRSAKIVSELEKEDLMLLESWRMASFCEEQQVNRKDDAPAEDLSFDDHLELSWKFAHFAIKAAEEIEEDQRKSTTLPYLGAAMLRLTERSMFSGQRKRTEEKLRDVMGPDWKKQVEEVQP